MSCFNYKKTDRKQIKNRQETDKVQIKIDRVQTKIDKVQIKTDKVQTNYIHFIILYF